MANLQCSGPLAVLFVEVSAGGERAVGPLSRFGGGTLLDQQIGALAKAGITEIAVLIDRMLPAISDTLAEWRERGVAISAFTDRMALMEWASEFGDMLILGHNLVATPATIHHAMAKETPTLFVRDAATSDDRHERIDLNDRWTGIALLPVRFLAELPDLAEDWSLQSALLRHAVQKGVGRESIAIGPMQPMYSEIMVDMGDLDRWQSRTMQAHFAGQAADATPWRLWVGLPLARTALPLMWAGREEALQLVTWGRYALLLLAIIVALLQWPMAALLILIPVVLLEEIDRQNAALTQWMQEPDMLNKAYWLAWAALPAIALMSVGSGAQLDYFLLGALLSASLAVSAVARPAGDHWVIGRDEAIVFILGAAIVGLSLTTGMLAASVAVLLSGFWRPIWARLKAI